MEDNTNSGVDEPQVEVGEMPTLHADMKLTNAEADMLATFRLMGITPQTVVVLVRGSIDILSLKMDGIAKTRLLTQKENLTALLNLLTVK
jgi:hypothetical protein